MTEFLKLKHNSMSVKEYSFKFNNLFKYSPTLVADPLSMINKIMQGIFDLINEECRTTMPVREMDISWLMTYVEQIEGEELRKRKMGESKRANLEGGFQGAE